MPEDRYQKALNQWGRKYVTDILEQHAKQGYSHLEGLAETGDFELNISYSEAYRYSEYTGDSAHSTVELWYPTPGGGRAGMMIADNQDLPAMTQVIRALVNEEV